ncbi:MAG: peptidase T [Tannerella sp.]|jgi:tripeptide aminopeptidase|nr:peptidase T [Tannerella sp.]
MDVKDLFLKYVTFDTQSDESSKTCPSTVGQRIFADYLAEQLKAIGMEDVSVDRNGYVTATLPGNCGKSNIPVIGFIAHLDTSPEMSGKNVNPRIVVYDGEDIILNKRRNIVLSSGIFPELNDYLGQEIIVTDGNTLLGADDKAGIAAIVSAMKYLTDHAEIRHGKVRVAFTPDEEIGRGADRFDVGHFGCDWAYTVDGGAVGDLEYENFNAAIARITFKGRNVHPGYAHKKMINAIHLSAEVIRRIPYKMRPENTRGREGFYHVISVRGSVEEAGLTLLIREHDSEKFELKKSMLKSLSEDVASKAGTTFVCEIKDQYYNMREIVAPQKAILHIAKKAMRSVGIRPAVKPVRGGTDGARLSYMGLPCPNLFSGGLNFHGRYEFLPVRSLEKSRETIIGIIAQMYRSRRLVCPSKNQSYSK